MHNSGGIRVKKGNLPGFWGAEKILNKFSKNTIKNTSSCSIV